MAIDLRNLLKDVIRGAMTDHDVPAPPLAIDENSEGAAEGDEELELFFQLGDGNPRGTRAELEQRLAEHPRYRKLQERAAQWDRLDRAEQLPQSEEQHG